MVNQWGLLLMVGGLGCILKGVDSGKANVQEIQTIINLLKSLAEEGQPLNESCDGNSIHIVQTTLLDYAGQTAEQIANVYNHPTDTHKDPETFVKDDLEAVQKLEKDYPKNMRCITSQKHLCVGGLCKACDQLTDEELCENVKQIANPTKRPESAEKAGSVGRGAIECPVVAVLVFALMILPITKHVNLSL